MRREFADVQKTVLSLVVLLGASFLSGCSSGLDDSKIIGRWVEDKVDQRFEFTKNHLYSVIENGGSVEVGTWTIDEKSLALEGLTRKRSETWKPDIDDGVMTIDQGDAHYRTLQKVKLTDTLFDKRLEGLWKTDKDPPDVMEFTAEGTAVGLVWQLDEKRQPLLLGLQGDVSRAPKPEAFSLAGFMGDVELQRVRVHPYKIEGGKFSWWGSGRKHKPKIYRKVKVADLKTFPKPKDSPVPADASLP